jgi:probable HAF family extracellular repeat protein
MKVRLVAALALAVVLLPSAQASTEQRAARYSVRDLGTLGGTVTAAADVNALSQVVGFSMTGDGFLHAFIWDRGVMTDLGTLGGESSYATAINDAGMVVGFSQIAHSRNSHAFLWRKGTGMKDLGTLGGDQSFAADINNAGLVVGRAFDAAANPRGFVWTSSTGMHALTGGDPFSVATSTAPGAQGPVAGSAGVPLVPGRWRTTGTPFSAFTLPGGFNQGQGAAIDARNDIVGSASTQSGLVRAFFRSSAGAMRVMRVPGIENSEAAAVSNSQRVVGTAYDDPFFLTSAWLARTPTTPARLLLELVPAQAAWTFAYATSVNDSGMIVGTGLHRGRTRGYLLTPDIGEQEASLRQFVPGGKAFHRHIAKTLRGAVASIEDGKKAKACKSLKALQPFAGRERTLAKPVRGIFIADIRGFRRSLACPGT